MNQIDEFNKEKELRIKAYEHDDEFKAISTKWLEKSMRNGYVYNYTWLGRPIIQNPVDLIALQEIIWEVQPDLIIETGIAHGGSLIFSASLLEVLSSCGVNNGKVLGIDIDIREHNLHKILEHPLSKRIEMIEGSSVNGEIIKKVKEIASNYNKVMVVLDSNHTHQHVLDELNAYADLCSVNSYCVVFDTLIEILPEDVFPDRPWGHGNNPMSAIREWLKSNKEFAIDESYKNKLFISSAPCGYLRRIK